MIDLLDSYARKGWRGFLIPRATSARDQRLPLRMRARVHLISMAPTGRARGSTHYASPSSLTCAALAEAAPLETRRLHERQEERRPTKQKHYAPPKSLFLFGAAALWPAREQREEHLGDYDRCWVYNDFGHGKGDDCFCGQCWVHGDWKGGGYFCNQCLLHDDFRRGKDGSCFSLRCS
ncbi:hypothetical protein BHM03_00048227 [Ensete ventricosum]|nr:hypothetical protein BHM03_00048227 [Ensete ventricosum]